MEMNFTESLKGQFYRQNEISLLIAKIQLSDKNVNNLLVSITLHVV